MCGDGHLSRLYYTGGDAMHELSIAMRVIDLAEVHCRAEGGGQVVAVTLRIGRLAAVEPHALRTALAMAAVGTLLEEATLRIVEVPVAIWCPGCEREVDLPGLVPLACPACGTRSGDIRRGDELDLESLEIMVAEVPA